MGMKVVGPRMFKAYPYTDAYMLDDARQIRDAVAMPMMLLGGIVDRPSIDAAMDSGFDFVAMGRGLLREPDLPAQLRADDRRRPLCLHCHRRLAPNYSGRRCAPPAHAPPTPA